MDSVESITIESWEAFENCLRDCQIFGDPDFNQKCEWLFRGAKRDWPIQSSLQRLAEGIGRGSEIRLIEQQLTKDFRRRITNFDGHSGRGELPESDLLAMMQHYGAPTRLIDWSYSPYWALFMALDRKWDDGPKEPSAVVWAMSASSKKAPNSIAKRLERDVSSYAGKLKNVKERKAWKNALDGYQAGSPDELVRKLIKEPLPCAFQLNSHWLNDRLSVQQGVFLCLGDPSKDLNQNLNRKPGPCQKWVIARGIEHELLRRLYRMNIHNGTAYPGLEGFARSLHMKSMLYRRMPED